MIKLVAMMIAISVFLSTTHLAFANGSNAVWLMNGSTRAGGGLTTQVANLDWTIAGVGDFNGDGKADILWRNTSDGRNAVWLMNGSTRAGGGLTQQVSDLNWTIAGAGDFDGDGKADILWRKIGGGGSGGGGTLALPVNAGDVIFTNNTMTGIWPFGAKGGDHPEGHGGIDFQVARGAPINAVAAGIVGAVTNSVYPGEKSIAIFIGSHETYYTGYFVDIFVTKGQSVEQGQALGTADFFNSGNTAWIHFGLYDKASSKDICPEPYFTSVAVSDLNNLLKSAYYPDKAKYPNICN